VNALVLALGLSAFAAGGESPLVGKPAADVVCRDWPTGQEVSLRNLRGRKVILVLYHTAC
jgi:peroxiredoxin